MVSLWLKTWKPNKQKNQMPAQNIAWNLPDDYCPLSSLVIFKKKNAKKTKRSESFRSSIWCIYKSSFPPLYPASIPGIAGTISTCFLLWQDLKATLHLHAKPSGFFPVHCKEQPQWLFATVIIRNFATGKLQEAEISHRGWSNPYLQFSPLLHAFPKGSVISIAIFLFCHSSWVPGIF